MCIIVDMRKKILITLITLSLFACVFTYIGIHYAFAQATEESLTISPSLMDLTANPGDTIKETFRIRNNTDTPIALSISVDKLDPHSRNGEVVPIKPQPNDPSISWVSFETTSFVANSREWVDIPVTISVPKTAAFGYYYAFLVGPNKTAGTQFGPTTKLLGEIVLPVLLNVTAPNAKSTLSLLSFTPQSFFNQYLPVVFSVTVQNAGNVALRPSGTIFVQLAGGNSDALNVNPSGGIILPGGIRTFSVPWKNGFLVQEPVVEDGNVAVDKFGHVITNLVIHWDKLPDFRIGKYTATALLVYDNGTRDVPMEASTTFWVFPYTAIGIGLASLIVLFLVLRFILKWYIAKEMKKYQNKHS